MAEKNDQVLTKDADFPELDGQIGLEDGISQVFEEVKVEAQTHLV